uniref:ARAD1D33242p n=1 Tax=Blastobotrys adeninivorans TaxID=409370 RepID=A0A060TC48_BLAAD
MSEILVTPRVDASLLAKFEGRDVRIIGKVKSLHGETCVIDSRGDVVVHLTSVAHLSQDQFYEIIGTVKEDHSIRMKQSYACNADIDFNMMDKLLALYHRHHSELFYE